MRRRRAVSHFDVDSSHVTFTLTDDDFKHLNGTVAYIIRPKSGHLDVVGRLECFNDPESYAGGSVKAPGRASQARQVEG